jgi:hypothetical protein
MPVRVVLKMVWGTMSLQRGHPQGEERVICRCEWRGRVGAVILCRNKMTLINEEQATWDTSFRERYRLGAQGRRRLHPPTWRRGFFISTLHGG